MNPIPERFPRGRCPGRELHRRGRRRTRPRTVAITNVRIFDGTRVIPKGTVVFQGGKIRAVGDKAAVPAGARGRSTAPARRSCRASSTPTPTPGATRWSAPSSSASPPSSTCSPTRLRRGRCADEQAKPAPRRPRRPLQRRHPRHRPRRPRHGIRHDDPDPHDARGGAGVGRRPHRRGLGLHQDRRSRTAPAYGRKIPTLDQATLAALVDGGAQARQAGGRPRQHRGRRPGGDRGGRGRPRPHLQRPRAGRRASPPWSPGTRRSSPRP